MWDSASGESRGSIDVAVQVLAFALSPVEDKIAVALPNATIQVLLLVITYCMFVLQGALKKVTLTVKIILLF